MRRAVAAIGSCYALSQRQQALLAALVAAGTLQDAAAHLGISCTSARNDLAELKTRLGVETVPMMTGLVLDLA